eukprot:474591-Pleurochrysis_carterae.AAC.2
MILLESRPKDALVMSKMIGADRHSIYVRVAMRERGGHSNSGVRASEHAWEICARNAVLRRRAAGGMRDCQTRTRQSFRSCCNYYSRMFENWIPAS